MVALEKTLPLTVRYEALYSLMQEEVIKFCNFKTKSDIYGISSEELSQESWLTVWRYLHRFNAEIKSTDTDERGRWMRLKGWVFIIINRRYLDLIDKYSRRPANFAYIVNTGSVLLENGEEEQSFFDILTQKTYDFADRVYVEELWKSLEEELPEKDFDLIKLYVSLGSSISQTANKVGMTRDHTGERLRGVKAKIKATKYFMSN